jgi:uncharacterized membrane protein YfcA
LLNENNSFNLVGVFIFYVTAALLAGGAAGLFSIGGGVFLVPALLYTKVPYPIAIGSVGLSVACSTLVALWRRRTVSPHMRLLLFILLGSMPATFVGGFITQISSDFGLKMLCVGYSALLVYLGYDLLYPKNVQRTEFPAYPYLRAVGIGAMGGMFAGMFGVGGAVLIIPLLMRWYGLTLVVASVTAQWQIMAATVVNLTTHGWHGTIDYKLALLLAAVGMVGARVGSELAAHLPVAKLRRYLGMCFMVIAAITLWRGVMMA